MVVQAADGRIGGTGDSCDMAWVVAKAGENPDGPAWTPGATSLLDACAADVPLYLARRDTGRMAKVLRAVVAAGADARHFGGLDLIAELEARYSPATGLYEPNFFYRHVLAVTALAEAGRPIPPGVLPALLAQQRPDGSWSWAVEADLSDGFQTPGDLDATGVTLQALRAAGLPLYHPAYSEGPELHPFAAARRRRLGSARRPHQLQLHGACHRRHPGRRLGSGILSLPARQRQPPFCAPWISGSQRRLRLSLRRRGKSQHGHL